MALNAAEEENIQSLKIWWDENGKRLAAVFLLVFGGYGGWQFWNNSVDNQTLQASELYEEILAIASSTADATSEEQDDNRIAEIAGQLKEEHGSSIYAKYAALFAAAEAAENSNLPMAESELQWILDNRRQGLIGETDEALVLTASLRLARVILARGEPERALAFINDIDPQTFEPGFAELRGDVYLAMDRLVDARDAYIAAQQAGSASELLDMKLADLPKETAGQTTTLVPNQ